jgi:hypothetical protein
MSRPAGADADGRAPRLDWVSIAAWAGGIALCLAVWAGIALGIYALLT